MNRNTIETRALAARDSLKRFVGKVGAGVTALAVSGAAMAQDASVGGAIKSEITAAKSSVAEILVALAAVIGMLLLWSYLKRAK